MFQYDVHGAFIGDMIDWLRQTTTYMSYRWAAKRLEVAPGNLVNIVKGTRRLPEERIPLVADIFKLSVDEAEYFGLLVAHDHAATEESRRATRDAMTGHRRIRLAQPVNATDLGAFGQWWHVAVRELLTMPQARADPAWIASVMVPPITPEQAQEAIDVLRATQLLPGQTDAASVGTSHQATVDTEGYQTGTMEIALNARARIDQADRFIVAFTATLSDEGWAVFVKRLERMVEVLFDHCETDPHPPDRVLQFNLQAFPVAMVPPRKR